MAIRIHRRECIGCGVCESLCPEVFALDNHGKAYVKPDADPSACDLEEVVNSCPRGAITIER